MLNQDKRQRAVAHLKTMLRRYPTLWAGSSTAAANL